ncbi:MAG: dTDP-4-dehydrorhamnose 3,5-epimerase family protein [Verrucomicrobiota bacterium]|nr:dTDP-4-dehydrorhamnose 3,5-epimerase family protein [Verrucomicrobiota bacterium]
MDVEPTDIPGLYIVRPKVFADERGTFVKTFHEERFKELGLGAPAEEFFSTSARSVIRGMHLQIPPHATTKCVCCLSGAVLDVVLDLRTHTDSYGKIFTRELTPKTFEMLFIPDGCAHGFLSLTDASMMFYQMSDVYAPNEDVGVRWDSFGFNWPVVNPIISTRDQALPALSDFVSPF